ncbi:MAG: DegT/DnrJ/EryC1/StrS family aminotransferase [Myxococcota bacterium]|nr:DegT/DnrJ/EryC1/StrS family aminotransferase [Myxococcota bacterium]
MPIKKHRSLKQGASKVEDNRYLIATETFSEWEIQAAKAVLDSGNVTMGREVQKFEEGFAEWVGTKYALMVNSGSSANLLAVDAILRPTKSEPLWRPGDEVLVSALSWPTTVWPLVQLGLKPVFVDINLEHLAIDLTSAEAALSPRTRGMFLIHVMGQVPQMSSYVDFCNKHNLVLLEDTCESLGGHDNGQHAGTFGSIGTFSCYFSHHVSTIEGGVITTDSLDIYNDLISMRSHGWIRNRSDKEAWRRKYPDIDERFFFVTSGYNVRPTEIQGAIGRVQLERLDDMLENRENLARQVKEWLGLHAPWIRLVGADKLGERSTRVERSKRTHSWMVLSLILTEDAPVSLQGLKEHLESNGVETRSIIAGNMVRHPAMQAINFGQAESLAVCDHVFYNGLMIGCHAVPTEASVATLETAIRSLSDL